MHVAVLKGHKEIISCLISWGATDTVRTYQGLLPADLTDDPEIKQLTRDEVRRYRGMKRTPVERADENESLGQASANTVAMDDGEDDDSDSDEEHEETYLPRTK